MKKSKSTEISKPEQDKQALQIRLHPGETEAQAHGRSMLSPLTNAAVNVFNFHPITGGCEINAILAEIGVQTKKVQDGDMSGPEAMLVAQAHALDIMFSSLAQRAALNSKAGYLGATESYMRLALKAQSQCRTTIEALGELKNPRTTTFNKQVNIAEQQQVNNGPNTETSTRTGAHASAREKNITPTNELLTEGEQHATLDTRGTGAAIGANQKVEAVGAIDRPR